jgi:hypothetical protein
MKIPTVVSVHFEKAMAKLAQVGLLPSASDDALSAFLPLIQRIEAIDPENALLIARVMQQSGNFNEIVRTQISAIDIGTRFITISNEFDSIRDDTRDMVTWISDGKLDWKEKAQLMWAEMRRGTVAERFEKIKRTFASVMRGTDEQISREEVVLSAYQDFRFSIKEAETAAHAIVAKALHALEAARAELQAANERINSAAGAAEKSSFELARDLLINQVHTAESKYQIAKDLSDNLKIAYNTSEVVFARLRQNIEMKRRIHEQSVSFFATNEIVFTGLSATFTSTQGLSEGTQALEQMKKGVNQSLEALADLGNQQLEASTRAGYGPAVDAKGVEKLANAIVDYQANMQALVEQLRKESTANANEIESVTNAAKTRFIELTTRARL